MTDTRVQQLVDELLDTDATPEAVCVSYPEFLPLVRDRWREICRVRADLDALFPASGEASSTLPEDPDLPRIPGYEVETVLGRGGMGIVFRARHERLNRPVALKMVLAGAYAGPRAKERFRREAEAAAGLRHSNVVQIYDVGDAGGQPYFTMELVDAGSLAQKLAGAPEPARQAAELVATLAGAMQAAHDRGIVHRDLKPSNVLLTADGAPKISDFGLARRVDDGAGLTQTGVAVGTPSYMAPEQARGQPDAVGPSADIYALGAILYELLTGRPPFRAATAAETVQQVLSQEPAPPSRLNDQVPRDLETICLKCLNKEPSARYATAAELADDLFRYLRGEPILARRAGSIERTVKWTRRNRSLAASIVIGTLLLNVVLGAGGWVLFERSAMKQAVNEDFDQVVAAQKQKKWDQSLAALERAKTRLGGSGPAELRQRAAQLERELLLAAKLEDILLDTGVLSVQEQPNGPRYEDSLREAGIFTGPEEPEVVAMRIRATGVTASILEALDGWAMHERDVGRRTWLIEVARLADENPVSRRIRDARPWDSRPALEEFARSASLKELSVPFLHFLGIKLNELRGDVVAYYRRIHQAHTSNSLANEGLAYVLFRNGDYLGSLPYFQAAIALRPTLHRVRHNYGTALVHLGKADLALVEFEAASRLHPEAVHYNESFGRTLILTKQPAQAERHFRQVLVNQPKNSTYQTGLALSLLALDRHDEAIDIYRRVIAAHPKDGFGYRELKNACLSARRWDEARDAWKQYLATDPHDPHGNRAWEGYAELCLYSGNESEYRRARTELLKRFGNTTSPHAAERTVQACLLLPASEDELRLATDLINRALASKANPVWLRPHLRFAKALSDYRAGRMKIAFELLPGDSLRVLTPDTSLLLAMVQHRLDHVDAARKTYNAAIAAFNWDPAKATNREAWMYHILRREAETVLASKP